MKKLLTVLLVAALAVSAQAKIVYLNNNVQKDASKNLFNNMTDAYAACTTPGDTIYVEGSVHGYGSLNISKKITLIGPGFLLTENSQTHVNKTVAYFNDLNLNSGSEGTLIKSLVISEYGAWISIFTDNITIENCYFVNGITLSKNKDANLFNIIVRGCYFHSTDANIGYGWGYDGIIDNLVFSNNILNGEFHLPSGSKGIISNNLFKSDVFKPKTTSAIEIINNIFLGDNPDEISMQPLPNSAVSHNLSISNLFGSDNNNLEFVTESTIFIGSEGNSTDGQYQLAASSPARNAGKNGVDIGPFGGPEPYRLSGLPFLPNIYEISTGGFVVGDRLPVHIKIKQQ